MASVIINGTTYRNPKGFITDDCHKIWLIRDERDMAIMKEAGWDEHDIRDIRELPETWALTCPLRFIYTGTLDDIIPQGHEVEDANIRIIDDNGSDTTADTGKLVNTLVNEIVADTYSSVIDTCEHGMFTRVCRAGQDTIVFVIAETRQPDTRDNPIPMLRDAFWHHQAAKWLNEHDIIDGDTIIRFDIITIDKNTRSGHLTEHAF